MNPTIYLCVVLFGLCAATHGHHTPHHVDGHDEHNSTNLASQRISRSLAEFAIKFYRHICSTSPGKNIFFSPYSISSALSLLLLASKSTTHSQMLEGLGFNLTEIQENDIHNAFHHLFHKMTRSDSNVRLELGQALFLDDELKPLQKFLDDVQAFYDAEVLTAKFQEPKEAEKQINDYVEKKTHGKIVELVKGLDPVTALVLVNYIFFKGNWEKPFDPQDTIEKDFFVNKETTFKVQMMRRLGRYQYYVDQELSATVLRLEYNGTAVAYFIMPEEGKFQQLEDAISIDTVRRWAQNFHWGSVNVGIPKFNVSASYDLKDPLTKMGFDLFSDRTDLSGITGKPELKVSKVTHKAMLTVNERGTEAAGATAIEIIPMSRPDTIEFDRPFLILIFEQTTGSVIFVGKIVNPTADT